MINDHLDKTIACLVADAEYLSDFEFKLESFNAPGTTAKDQQEMVNSAFVLILHIIDYYVTVDIIDMEADIYRFCQKDPGGAAKFAEKINKAGINLKCNYQRFFKEGTIYTGAIKTFPTFYAMLIGLSIDIKHGANPAALLPNIPLMNLRYEDIEFIAAADDEILEKKFKSAKKLEFTLDSIKDFINDCFKWSDMMKDYLDRAFAGKNFISFDVNRLSKLHLYSNGKAYTNTSAEHFAQALTGQARPTFHIIHRDFFYTILYALYVNLGPLCPREQWLRDVLDRFELSDKDYYSTKSRLEGKGKKTDKLIERFEEIQSILQG